MGRILVLYATREGQTEKIAQYIGSKLRERGWESDVRHVPQPREEIDLSPYDSAVLAAPVHTGKHPPEMVAFVKAHRPELDAMSAAFLSVSLSEIGVEDRTREPAARERYAADVQKMVDDFVKETGWKPATVFAVAGALMYRKYNVFIRWIMRRIARQQGASTDTSQNIEYTDWTALDQFVERWTMELAARRAA